MSKQSAGLLVFRHNGNLVEVLLVHPGGPFWAKKDSWSIPKGETEDDEDLLEAAKREFEEETGLKPTVGPLIELGSAKQGSKTNFIWAVEGDFDLAKFKSNTFQMEWPPNSGQEQEFPEVDKAQWFSLDVAMQKVFKAQTVFLERLADLLQVEVAEAPTQTELF